VAPDASAGFHHALVRTARTLHLKKHRQERRCFLIEGPTCVESALAAEHVEIEHIFVCPGNARADAIAASAAASGRRIISIDERTLDSIAQTQSPQGIVAVARFFHREIGQLPDVIGHGPAPCLVAALHRIGDPGNAGTLIRSAEAFGVAALCCGAAGVDPYNDKVVRASMGSIFHLPLFLYDGWEQLARAAAEAALSVVAAEAGAPDVRSVTIPQRSVLVVGHERAGLADIPAEDIALRIGIPQRRRAESLNAGVAGSIALYEIARASHRLPGTASEND
jgi:TrmH family RNA methyltransferase